LTHVAAWVPVGSLADRITLFSAACAALAVGFVFLTLRTLDVHRIPASGASLFFAFTPTLWSQAVIAEVYGLQLALMSFAVLCWVRWWKSTNPWWAIAGLAIEAVMLGNHMMSVTLAPATVWLLWRGRRRITRVQVIAAALSVLIPVALYSTLYIWTELRPSLYVESPVSSWQDLRYVVTGSQFHSDMFAYSAGEVIRDRVPMVWNQFWDQFGWLIAMIAVGAVAVVRRHRTIAAFFGLIALADLIVVVNYAIYDIFIYFLPAWIVATVVLGVGFDALLDRIRPRALAIGAAAVVLALPIVPLVGNWADQDMSGGVPEARYGQAALAAAPDNALMISSARDYNLAEIVWYHLFGEGEGTRRNISLYPSFDADAVCRYLRDGTPPDTTWKRYVNRKGTPTPLGERPPPGLAVFAFADEYPHLTGLGFTMLPTSAPELFQVLPPPSCQPAPSGAPSSS
jgi:hypothetical protein